MPYNLKMPQTFFLTFLSYCSSSRQKGFPFCLFNVSVSIDRNPRVKELNKKRFHITDHEPSCNISYRTGRKLTSNLETETFDDDAEADSYLSKNYGYPFVVPKGV